MKPWLVFAYNYNPDGTCAHARRTSSYTNPTSAKFAALALRRWYDIVYVA